MKTLANQTIKPSRSAQWLKSFGLSIKKRENGRAEDWPIRETSHWEEKTESLNVGEDQIG